jgi:hypothetical protein
MGSNEDIQSRDIAVGTSELGFREQIIHLEVRETRQKKVWARRIMKYIERNSVVSTLYKTRKSCLLDKD